MKKYESSCYRAVSIHGTSSLNFRSIPKSVEEVRKEIDESNENAVKKGYNAHSWLITYKTVLTYYDDNNVFVSQGTAEKVIEIYPPILPIAK